MQNNNRSAPSDGNKREQRRQLKLVTFGDATLSFLDVPVTNINQTVNLIKREGPQWYTNETDGKWMIKIEYERDNLFTVGLFNKSRWVTNLYVDPEKLNIGNASSALSTQVTTKHIKQNKVRNVHTTFKFINRSGAMLKRLDIRETPRFTPRTYADAPAKRRLGR